MGAKASDSAITTSILKFICPNPLGIFKVNMRYVWGSKKIKPIEKNLWTIITVTYFYRWILFPLLVMSYNIIPTFLINKLL